MDEKISLKYGEETVEIDVRGAASIETILPKPMEEITDLRKAFLRAVEQDAIGGVTLKDAVGPEDEVTIVVSDITRSWMHQDRVMPLLVEYLHDRIGVPYEKTVILIALGTHRKSTPEEMVKICSKRSVIRCGWWITTVTPMISSTWAPHRWGRRS